jgi:hypothetical protein
VDQGCNFVVMRLKIQPNSIANIHGITSRVKINGSRDFAKLYTK